MAVGAGLGSQGDANPNRQPGTPEPLLSKRHASAESLLYSKPGDAEKGETNFSEHGRVRVHTDANY